jgi:hypothetical protein
MASPAWPPVVRCRQSVSQLFPPHSVSKRKADARRPTAASAMCKSRNLCQAQMEDGKDAQWSVNMYLQVKTCLDWRYWASVHLNVNVRD